MLPRISARLSTNIHKLGIRTRSIYRFYYSADGKKLPREMEAAMTSDDGGASFKDQMRRAFAAAKVSQRGVDSTNGAKDINDEISPVNKTAPGLSESFCSSASTVAPK